MSRNEQLVLEQRKKDNDFLGGMLVLFLILGTVIFAFLGFNETAYKNGQLDMQKQMLSQKYRVEVHGPCTVLIHTFGSIPVLSTCGEK